MKSEWKFVGNLAVDSGQMLVIDPCYVLPRGVEGGKPDYDDLIKQWKDDDKEQIAVPVEGLGWVTNTGFGDGTYPLYAYVNEGRTMALVVLFGSREDLPSVIGLDHLRSLGDVYDEDEEDEK
jgi:hypothetical protein